MGRVVILGIDELEFVIGAKLDSVLGELFRDLELAQVVLEGKLEMSSSLDLEPGELKLLNRALCPVEEISGLADYPEFVRLQIQERQRLIRELRHRLEMKRNARK
jgi:hypothetical protein